MSKSSFSHRIEYSLIRFFAFLFRALPVSWSVGLGMAIGWFAYRVIGIRRKVALSNLSIAFPQKPPAELERIACKSYCHWGGMGAEFASLPKISERYIRKYIIFDGEDVLRRANEQGKGTLIISGHFGNWELMGSVNAYLGYKVTYIVATQTNKLVDKFIDDLRRMHGIQIWKMRNAPRGILASLRDNRYIALMIDQDAGRDCVFVPFFDKDASTHKGPAIFHLLKGAPLVISSCTRIRGPRYRILFEEVNLPSLEGDNEAKIYQIMAYLTKLLEEKVCQHPEQYFWMHKRWKTRPP